MNDEHASVPHVDALGRALRATGARLAAAMPAAADSAARPPADPLAAEPAHGGAGRAVARTLALARRLVADVPGCRALRLENTDAPNMDLVCSGWSPSLHHQEWAVEVDATTAVVDPASALAGLDPALDLMRARARDAARLGLDAPLERGDGGREQPVDLAHLAVDRGWLAVALEGLVDVGAPVDARGADPARTHAERVRAWSRVIVVRLNESLAASVGRAHESAPADTPGHVLGTPYDRVREIARGDAWPAERVVETHRLIRLEGGRRAVILGSELTLGATLPDAVLAACAGRRLGEIATVHPALDHRVVERARHSDDPLVAEGVVFSLAPDLVRVCDLAETLERLIDDMRGEGE